MTDTFRLGLLLLVVPIAVILFGVVVGVIAGVHGVLPGDPELRYGKPYLTLANYHLDRGEPAGALPHLERFTALHASSVEDRYKLAQAFLATEQPARARAALDEGIQAYRGAPPFKRQEERLWRLRAGWPRGRLAAR